jgi:hypothetical protein
MYSSRAEQIIPSANRLRRDSPLMGFVYKVLNKELVKINALIDNAHRNGKDNVVVKLTFNFTCPDYIENKEVQTNVYYKIIDDLQNKNYTIGLKLNPKDAFLHINWKVTIDNEKITRMEDLIKSVLL